MRTALAFLTLAAAAAAQSPTHTLPKGYLTKAGNDRHWVPSHFAPSFAQTTYSSDFIDLPTGTIRALSLRPDEQSSTMESHEWNVSIWLSSADAPEPSHVITGSYAANHGTDRTKVLDDTRISFPAVTPRANGPEGWQVRIPIQPFGYQSGRPLQVEWEVHAPATREVKAWFTDAQLFTPPGNSGYFYREVGWDKACPPRVTTYAGEVGGPGDLCSIWFYSMGDAGQPAAMFFGTQRDHWNGVPLPIDLGSIGHPGCSVFTDWSVEHLGTTDSPGLGRLRADLRLPFDNSIAQQIFWTQAVVYDPSYSGGLRVSDLGKITIGRSQPTLAARHLYSYKLAPTDQPEFASYYGPILGIEQ